ncbi:MAG: cytochrome C [Paracoccus sp. (in: a-proteobacteria)]|uniref:c-type cytochrome n=1 Tax=Paracoccus sp. TaxID=267 RepID=UPI0039E4B891
MKLSLYLVLAATVLTPPAWAQDGNGDATRGEKEFRKCKACHMIRSPDGADLVKGGKMGPNLYAILGRKAGTAEGFRYSDALRRLGEAGEVWTAEELARYVTDPNAYVEEKLDDPAIKTRMTFKLARNQTDLVAFLAQHPPPAETPAPQVPASD